MKKYLQKFICIFGIICLVCTGCSAQSIMYQKTDTAMGTIISLTVYASSDKAGQEVTENILSCINDLERDYLSWRLETSEIYRINAEAGKGQDLELSPFLSDVLSQSKKVHAASDGAFDFSMGSVSRLWDIDSWAVKYNQTMGDVSKEAFLPPSDEQIAEVLKYSGADKINIDGKSVSLPAGMQLDLGAIGKGIALDEVYKCLLAQKEITGAVISVGGSILTYGNKPDGSMWNVGIVDPFDTSRNLGVLTLPGGCRVSTSGDYERYVEVDGVRYHHILNPFTGKPSDNGVRSVTILCDNGLFSDALSTACFVLGVDKGLELANEFDAEALIVDNMGELHMTDGMNQYLYLSNAGK